MPGHRREVTTPSCVLVIAAQKASRKQLAWSSLAQNHIPKELQFCWQNLWAQRGAELGFSWVNVHVKHQNGEKCVLCWCQMGLCEYFWNCWNFQAPQSEATLLIRGQKDYRNSDGGGGDGVKVLGMVSWHHLGFTSCYLQMATSSLTTHRVTHLKGFHDNEADFSGLYNHYNWICFVWQNGRLAEFLRDCDPY